MKCAVLCLIALASLTSRAQASDAANSTHLSVVAVSGNELDLNEGKEFAVKFWIQQLVLSAVYQDIVTPTSLQDWESQVGVVPRIACRYPPGSKIALPEKRTLEFEYVVVPLVNGRRPDYLYVRHEDSVLRLAMYDPWVFQKLLVESGLAPPESLTVTRYWF